MGSRVSIESIRLAVSFMILPEYLTRRFVSLAERRNLSFAISRVGRFFNPGKAVNRCKEASAASRMDCGMTTTIAASNRTDPQHGAAAKSRPLVLLPAPITSLPVNPCRCSARPVGCHLDDKEQLR